MFKKLEKYLKNWHELSGIKPNNEIEFFNEFVNFISPENFENLDFEFDGDGSYFGKQFTISIYNNRQRGYLLQFEVVYSQNKISVYTANNNGYWTPEYICIEKGVHFFEELQTKISKLLFHFFGINHLINV